DLPGSLQAPGPEHPTWRRTPSPPPRSVSAWWAWRVPRRPPSGSSGPPGELRGREGASGVPRSAGSHPRAAPEPVASDGQDRCAAGGGVQSLTAPRPLALPDGPALLPGGLADAAGGPVESLDHDGLEFPARRIGQEPTELGSILPRP